MTTIEDFHRPRFLYQLTREGEAVERALAAYDEHLGRRGSLQAVALADIAAQLRALEELARQSNPDSARVSLLLRDLVGRFTDLADNAQAFMGSLQRTIDLYDADIETFRAYKDQLVEYLERFIKDLVTVGAEIAGLLDALERTGIARLLAIAAARDAEDAAPGPLAPDDPRTAAYEESLAGWNNRWLGLRRWFVADAEHPSQAKLLRTRARSAIPQLLAVVASLNERRSGRSDRSADFRTLAQWFAQAPDDASMHRLWRVAFGVGSARHLVIDGDTLEAREEHPVAASIPGRRPAAEDQPTASSDRQLRSVVGGPIASSIAPSTAISFDSSPSERLPRRRSSAVGYEGCCPAQPARKARGRFVRAVLDAARGRAGNAPTRTTRGDDDHQRRHAACSPHLSGWRCPRRDPYAVGGPVRARPPHRDHRSGRAGSTACVPGGQRPHYGTPSRNGHRLPLEGPVHPMSDTLDGALQRAESVQLRRAARALLRRPLLRADGPEAEEFQLVRRHAARLRTWFDLNTGWRLIVDSEVARLVKMAPATTDATHPARDVRSGLPFGRRRYVLTCLALAVLERADGHHTLGWLADRLILAAADDEIAQAGVVFRLEGRDERSDLVAAVRLLLSLGVLARVAGDEDAFVRDAGDALYDVQRRSLALLLAAPRGPSTVAARSFHERLTALAEEHLPEVDELRNRAMRQRITRRLLDDAVLYYAELDAAEAEYLVRQRGAVVQRISELTGLSPRCGPRASRWSIPTTTSPTCACPTPARTVTWRCCSPSTSPGAPPTARPCRSTTCTRWCAGSRASIGPTGARTRAHPAPRWHWSPPRSSDSRPCNSSHASPAPSARYPRSRATPSRSRP